MTTDQGIVFAILGASLVLFAWGRWRYDLVALAAMVAVVLAGLVPASEALQGFGHPAVLTVAAVLVISRALRNSGIVELLARGLTPFTGQTIVHVALLTIVVAICSAFMNNVGALALLLPVALATAVQQGRSPAIVLMPLAFGSILGGMMTMIGTPPNVIIATYRAELTGTPFGIFDFSPVGVGVAALGIAFVALVGWRLIPKQRRGQSTPDQLFEIGDYIAEARIGEDSPLVDQLLGHADKHLGEAVEALGVVGRGSSRVKSFQLRRLRAGDVLLLRADPSELKPVLDATKLELLAPGAGEKTSLESEETDLVEVVVAPRSAVEGRLPAYLRRRTGYSVDLLALARQGEPMRHRLRTVALQAGDVLLLRGDTESLNEALGPLGLLPLAGRDLRLHRATRAGLALAVFAAALAASAFGLVPIVIAFLLAILAYVLLDILPTREIYRDIDWPVIVLLGAMIPVGRAIETTGGTTLIAGTITDLTAGLPVALVLGLVLVVTMTLSDIINNAATTLVMAPIAVGVAGQLGVAADPFLMAVAVGASCAFLTPIGHQSNTIVMGPGGYRFGDYWRMGLPLEILITLVSVPLIMAVWPL